MIKALEEGYPERLHKEQLEIMNTVMTSEVGVSDYAALQFARGQVNGIEYAKHMFNELMFKMRNDAEDLRDE